MTTPSGPISFSIIKPDDMHIHFRDGDLMRIVANATAKQFARAVVMPNLLPPVTTVEAADAYAQRILAATSGSGFTPLTTLYLTNNTSAAEIDKIAGSNVVGCKLYPAGATTNSDSGVTDVRKIYAVLEAMQKHNVPLQIHGEVTELQIDIFDREAVFIDKVLQPLCKDFPALRVVFEHITTKNAADFVASAGKKMAATITAHHLLFNRNHMLAGGIRPHYYCLPILKAEEHRKALVVAALGNSGKFFAGTDSAPHLQHKKETACGCAGCYTGNNAVELYAETFDAENLALPATQQKFENFMSKFGADFYGLDYNGDKISLTKTATKIAEKLTTPEGDIIPLLAGQETKWSVQSA